MRNQYLMRHGSGAMRGRFGRPGPLLRSHVDYIGARTGPLRRRLIEVCESVLTGSAPEGTRRRGKTVLEKTLEG